MANEKKTNGQVANGGTRTPLFTGDFRRDTVISEGEKAAEASQALFDGISKMLKNIKKKTKK